MIEFPKFNKSDDKPAPRWFHIAVALAMLLGAAASLVGSLRTSSTMKALVEENSRLVRANSTPLLTFGHGNASDKGEKQIEFEVANVGTGPARIVWFELRLDGKPMENMTKAVGALSAQRLDGVTLTFTSAPIAPRILAANNNARIFAWKLPDEKDPYRASWDALDKARFKRIEVEACFCSVFEQCWQSKMNADVPKPVDRCDPNGRTTLWG
ncbi:MAG: hypothetical protein ACRDAM_19795 [Casimicrobium sp.]